MKLISLWPIFKRFQKSRDNLVKRFLITGILPKKKTVLWRVYFSVPVYKCNPSWLCFESREDFLLAVTQTMGVVHPCWRKDRRICSEAVYGDTDAKSCNDLRLQRRKKCDFGSKRPKKSVVW